MRGIIQSFIAQVQQDVRAFWRSIGWQGLFMAVMFGLLMASCVSHIGQ